MAQTGPSRDEAFSLLTEYNKMEGLIKHSLAVAVGAAIGHEMCNTGPDEVRRGTAGVQALARIADQGSERVVEDIDALCLGLTREVIDEHVLRAVGEIPRGIRICVHPQFESFCVSPGR